MICCLNSDCLVPANPDGVTVCQSCGSPLIELLRNRYRPIKPLGQGGFGKTYLAEDVDRLNTRCVIKQFVRQASNKTFDKALPKNTPSGKLIVPWAINSSTSCSAVSVDGNTGYMGTRDIIILSSSNGLPKNS